MGVVPISGIVAVNDSVTVNDSVILESFSTMDVSENSSSEIFTKLMEELKSMTEKESLANIEIVTETTEKLDTGL